ncbi:UNVERIFIED_CONTAM: rod shape-determining protein MreC, partial [Salmonella enterica subsp. enterica serovar Enteritidis]
LTRPASAWDQSFTISAGSMQGVRENMLAASSEGVVGLVSHVETATSTVELLTSDTLVNDIAISIPLEDGTTV